MELAGAAGRPVRSIETSQSPPLGFTAVNNRYSLQAVPDSRPITIGGDVTAINKNSLLVQSATTNGGLPSMRDDPINKFLTESERQAGMTEKTVRRSSSGFRSDMPLATPDPAVNRGGYVRTEERVLDKYYGAGALKPSQPTTVESPTVPIPGTPSTLMGPKPRVEAPRDDGGPFKAEMVSRMENMARGERVVPPCDRCRRLQMDCMKNLTACQGCTKKHAKCSWKDVTADELHSSASSVPGNSTFTNIPTQVTTPRDKSAETPSRDWESSPKEKDTGDAMQIDHSPGDTVEVISTARRHEQEEPRASQVASPITANATAVPQAPFHRSTSPQHAPWSSPKFDVRPPKLDKPSIEGAGSNGGRASSHGQYVSPYGDTVPVSQRLERKTGTETDAGHDENDRLQELARQVYRSASQSVRPPSS